MNMKLNDYYLLNTKVVFREPQIWWMYLYRAYMYNILVNNINLITITITISIPYTYKYNCKLKINKLK